MGGVLILNYLELLVKLCDGKVVFVKVVMVSLLVMMLMMFEVLFGYWMMDYVVVMV